MIGVSSECTFCCVVEIFSDEDDVSILPGLMVTLTDVFSGLYEMARGEKSERALRKYGPKFSVNSWSTVLSFVEGYGGLVCRGR